MKDIFFIVVALVCIATPVYFIIVFIKAYREQNKSAKENLYKEIEQCKNTITETEAQAEARLKEYERERVSRDIKLAMGYTNDHLVNIVLEYCPGKLMSTHNLAEMKKEIIEAEDDYYFDNFIKEKYLPIIGNADFWLYHYELLQLKSAIRLHKGLTPHEVIGQIDFYRQNNKCNINELELLSCVKSLNLRLYPDHNYTFANGEVRDIATLIAERFGICITENIIEDIIHPSDHSSYHRSELGISRIYARTLFYSEEIYSQLSFLDEDVFVRAIEKYFFHEVCYDIKQLQTYLSEIINYVKEHRTFVSNI